MLLIEVAVGVIQSNLSVLSAAGYWPTQATRSYHVAARWNMLGFITKVILLIVTSNFLTPENLIINIWLLHNVLYVNIYPTPYAFDFSQILYKNFFTAPLYSRTTFMYYSQFLFIYSTNAIYQTSTTNCVQKVQLYSFYLSRWNRHGPFKKQTLQVAWILHLLQAIFKYLFLRSSKCR